MRVYFLSSQNAALKLNGIFLGFVSNFEKFIDLSLNEKIFAEFLPESADFYPISFAINKNFINAPPNFCNVFEFEGGIILEITQYPPRQQQLQVLNQKRIGDFLFTLYFDGETKFSIENGKNFEQVSLPEKFENADISQVYLDGELFFGACFEKDDKKYLIIFSNSCEKVFANKVIDFSLNGELVTKIAFDNPARHVAEITWQWKNNFSVKSYKVSSQREIDITSAPTPLIPILFFNEILVCGTPEKYLCDTLKARSGEFRDYLGEFTSVIAPPDIIEITHPNEICAGLVYPKNKNKFQIKFFGVTLENNLITNVFPVM